MNFFQKKEQGDLEEIADKIEAILFYRADEVSYDFLSKFLKIKREKLLESIVFLKERKKNSPIVLIENGDKVSLAISGKYSNLLKEFEGEENNGPLSNSSLETLAIILYKGPLTKSEIEHIRGVNSSYILRNLLIRGLIERKKVNGKDLYFESIDFLRFLGVENKEQIPYYEKVRKKIEEIENNFESELK